MRPRALLLLLLSAIVAVVLLTATSFIGISDNTPLCRTLWYFRSGDAVEHCQSILKPNSADLPDRRPLREREHISPQQTAPAQPINGTCRGTHEFPKVVHLLWKEKIPPANLKPYVDSWHHHNPDWEVRVWDDDSLTAFLQRSLDTLRFRQWQDFPSSVGKMDVARLLLMELLGGVYSDLDVKCYACLNALLSRQPPEVSLLLPREWSGEDKGKASVGLISNFWLASIPNATAVRYLVGNIPTKREGKWQWPNDTYFKDYDPDPSHNNFDGVLNTAGPRYIQRRWDTADETLRKMIVILPSIAWAALNKEVLWTDIEKRWEELPEMQQGIANQQIFGLHFHAGIWWSGPASAKFYGGG